MSSMLYTMGMALDRAAEHGFLVSVLVHGAWVDGQVAAYDGVGLVLESLDGQHCVVKADQIAAVKVFAESPYKVPITAHAGAGASAAARPMPGPRVS